MGSLTRRAFLEASVAALGALSFVPRAHGGHGRSGRPNILFILTDDQRFDAMGCAGNPIIQTPNVDRLAGEGVRFERAFVTTPICAASRASILTGTFERTHTYTFTKPPLGRAFVETSYPVLLRRAGYRTGFVGKFGVEVEKGVEREMFEWTKFTSFPYFQNVGGVEDALYKDVVIPVPEMAAPVYYDAQPEFLKNTMSRTRWAWRFDTPEKYQAMVKGYYRMISGVDMVLGRVLRTSRTRLPMIRPIPSLFTGSDFAAWGAITRRGLLISGPVEITLYVSSDAKDTDFTVKLVDVYPDGKAYNLDETVRRVRYREGYDKELFMGGNNYDENSGDTSLNSLQILQTLSWSTGSSTASS